jgi:hypothetical protein
MKAVQERMDATLRERKAEIRATNEKFEVLQGTLVCWMDIHQARADSTQENINTKIDVNQEKMDASEENTNAKIDDNQEKMDANQIMADLKT